jgi:hypothetical protein
MDWSHFVAVLGQSISDSAFWVGFVLVAVYALNRFAISDSSSDESDPPLGARSFTTRFRYYLSAATYVVCFEFAFGVLVGIGSFPFLQDVLIQWIGTLDTGEEGAGKIGTPAWAALVVTTLLPAAPGFSRVDGMIRSALQEFASIPHKARGLAKEIVKYLGERDGTRDKTEQLRWLFGAMDDLKTESRNPHNAGAYIAFFTRYASVLEQARRKKSKLEQQAKAPADDLEQTVDNAARFLSCALLLSESSERNVRSAVRETLQLDLPRLRFDFNFKQIILGLVLVLVLTFAAGLVTLGLALPDFSGISMPMIGFVASWLPYSALMLLPAFIFAAGVQLYFMDRRQYQLKVQLEDRILALIGLFVLTFGIGILPPLLGMSWRENLPAFWYMQVLPFGLTPAVVAVLFYILATRRYFGSRGLQAAFDFAVFAGVAGFVTWCATTIAFHFDLSIPEVSKIPEFTNRVARRVFPATSAVLIGVVGMLQCLISRPRDT